MAAPLSRVKALLAALPRQDQEDLHRYLSGVLFEAGPGAGGPARHVATLEDAARKVTYTYRSERVRCGKEGCACRRGPGHGPYLYKYWKEGGRLRKKYVGKATAGPAAPQAP